MPTSTTPAPISALVVDDEPPARRRIEGLLSGHAEVTVVGTAADGATAIERIVALRPQILFLDIEMPVLDGFCVLRALPQPLAPVTIFATAYDRYAVAAFEAQAVDYLLKPFSDERFEAALTRAIRAVRDTGESERRLVIESVVEERSAVGRSSGHLERIVIKKNARVTLVDVTDIDWIGAAGIYLELHTGSTSHLYRSSLGALVERLDPTRFLRVHRSVVINTDRIKELRPRGHSDYTVVLRDGRMMPLSRTYRTAIEAWLRQPL